MTECTKDGKSNHLPVHKLRSVSSQRGTEKKDKPVLACADKLFLFLDFLVLLPRKKDQAFRGHERKEYNLN